MALLEGVRVAVIGGSIGGLAAATALVRLGAIVSVFERSPAPFAGLGGSIGFCNVPLWESVCGKQMVRRGVQASRAQGAFLYGDLWRFWYSSLPAGTVRFGREVASLGDDPRAPVVDNERFDMAVVADGGWSKLRARYFDAAAPRYAGYDVYRFRVERKHVPFFATEGDARSSLGGPFYTILLQVTADDGSDWVMGGTAVAKPESEVVAPKGGANRQVEDAGGAALAADAAAPSPPAWFLPFYARHFGGLHGGELLRVMTAAAQHGKITAMPQYEFASASVVSGRLLLLGDAAHMASPRTASGAHTAVLDAAALSDAFSASIAHLASPPSASSASDACLQAAGSSALGRDESRIAALIDRALSLYDQPGRARAAALYARSREVSAPLSVQGWPHKE